jgi:hypothetical protein
MKGEVGPVLHLIDDQSSLISAIFGTEIIRILCDYPNEKSTEIEPPAPVTIIQKHSGIGD